MYSENELTAILSRLRALPAETEVVEFKKAKNGFGDDELGQYFSALSNEANLKSVPYAWLVFGVDDKTHEVLGSNYKQTRPSLDAMKKAIADQTTSRVTFEEIYAFKYDGKRVVMFQIPAAPQGMPIAYQGHFSAEMASLLLLSTFRKSRPSATKTEKRTGAVRLFKTQPSKTLTRKQ